MNNPQLFIPSHGLGEIYLDLSNMYWYMHNSPYYKFSKEIPFLKFLLDMTSLRMRCYTQLNLPPHYDHDLFNCILMHDTAKRSTYLVRSFIKIQSLAEDLFSTGVSETLNYCMEVYRQFINKEKLDVSQGLKLALTNLRDELSNFKFYSEKLLTTLHFFLPKKYKETLDKTKQIFLMDLQNQFKRHIRKIGNYSEEEVFWGNLWQERSFFINKEVPFSENFFLL